MAVDEADAGPPTPHRAAMSSVKKDQVGICERSFTIRGTRGITEPYWHRKV